jgi:hypothetical protein
VDEEGALLIYRSRAEPPEVGGRKKGGEDASRGRGGF